MDDYTIIVEQEHFTAMAHYEVTEKKRRRLAFKASQT